MGAIIFLTQANNNGLVTDDSKNEKDKNFTKMNSLSKSYAKKLETESILVKINYYLKKENVLIIITQNQTRKKLKIK